MNLTAGSSASCSSFSRGIQVVARAVIALILMAGFYALAPGVAVGLDVARIQCREIQTAPSPSQRSGSSAQLMPSGIRHISRRSKEVEAYLRRTLRSEPRPFRNHARHCPAYHYFSPSKLDFSQARANFQSRMTVGWDTFSAAAVSSTERPPKNRNSTTLV